MRDRAFTRVIAVLLLLIAGGLLAWKWARTLRGDPPIYHDRGGDVMAPFAIVYALGLLFLPGLMAENIAMSRVPRNRLEMPTPARLVRSWNFWVSAAGLAACVVNGLLLIRFDPRR